MFIIPGTSRRLVTLFPVKMCPDTWDGNVSNGWDQNIKLLRQAFNLFCLSFLSPFKTLGPNIHNKCVLLLVNLLNRNQPSMWRTKSWFQWVRHTDIHTHTHIHKHTMWFLEASSFKVTPSSWVKLLWSMVGELKINGWIMIEIYRALQFDSFRIKQAEVNNFLTAVRD